ncbi:hypothetical protein ACFOUS_22205 [Deinococcus metalli]|uniref:hypothetical protein n=1 Tax=Deinococcus metalli TaxID=1141878 RepID=UPI00360A5102
MIAGVRPHQRAVILGQQLCAGVLSTAALGVVAEAYWRLQSPVPVQTTVMLALAVLGLGINVISARLAATDARETRPRMPRTWSSG